MNPQGGAGAGGGYYNNPATKANGGVGTNLPYNRVPLVEANETGGTVNLPTVCPDYNTAFLLINVDMVRLYIEI